MCCVPRTHDEEHQDIFGERQNENFHGGPVIKNLPATAGDTGSIPGPETKTLCAVSQINPWATTAEPASRATGYDTEASAPRACALQQQKAPQ